MSQVKSEAKQSRSRDPLGPCFYVNLHVGNNANKYRNSRAMLHDWAKPEWGAYLAPAAVKNPYTILTGTLYFSPDEVEVFYVDHTQ